MGDWVHNEENQKQTEDNLSISGQNLTGVTKKHFRNSILCILCGLVITFVSCILKAYNEPINYIGGMFIFGGFIFLDQKFVLFCQKKQYAKVNWRLAIYMVLAFASIQIPILLSFHVYGIRFGKSFGMAFLLLALWRFFTLTTVKRQEI